MADIIFLATPFRVIESVLKGISFNGKTLVDCTNPVGQGITHGLNSIKSGELSQALHLEHMTLLWVKMVRMNGHHQNFVCTYLER